MIATPARPMYVDDFRWSSALDSFILYLDSDCVSIRNLIWMFLSLASSSLEVTSIL